MKKIRKRILSLLLSIFWGIIYLAYLMVYIFLIFAQFGYTDLTIAIFTSMSTILFVIVLLLVIYTISFYQKEKEHLNFDEEIFGERIYFYNVQDFVKDIFDKKTKNKEAYIIAYSPIKSTTSNEVYQSKELKLFYNYLAKYFISEFTKKENKTVRYCFDSNIFIIYKEGNKDEVLEVITGLQNISYSIIKEHDLRLFIQNFVGFCQLPNKNDIYESISKAKLTRRIAEYNFEPVLEFDEKYVLNENEANIAEAIAKGLKNNEFLVYYQPKYGLTTKSFVGCEALVRWNSSELGFVSPLGFINYAENKGLIHEIDLFVFEQVCKDLADLKRRGKRILPVSINFSLYEFFCPTFLDDIKKCLDKYEVNPMLIEIEITEETQHANSFLIISLLKKLREAGMRVLLDDFGLGFSNFGSLKILPIDTIKIDKSFIDEIAYDYKARQIVKTIIDFAKIMGIQTVAEGVEDVKQVETLRKLKCDIIQGFYYSKPLPKAEYDKFLSSNPFEKKEANQ